MNRGEALDHLDELVQREGNALDAEALVLVQCELTAADDAHDRFVRAGAALELELRRLREAAGRVVDEFDRQELVTRANRHVVALRGLLDGTAPGDPADDDALPEVECPACGATIRARLADQPTPGRRA